jgi:phytoene dehydrogenase-like protein
MAPAWDAIVIGSGIGGLSAAGLLARVAGMKVLVLEKHSERGGQTHMFRRDGAAWDVGLHSVGELD